VSDESHVLVTRKTDESSLILSSARSGLVARGRREAALLLVPCNKCGERSSLVFAGCVCASCSDALDKQWGTCTATDWVLLTNFVTEEQKQRNQKVAEIMQSLKASVAKAKGEQVREGGSLPSPFDGSRATSHIYRKTTYAEMKVRWANQEPENEFELSVGHCRLRDLANDNITGAMPSPIPLIRPATSAEIACHDLELGMMYHELGDYPDAAKWYQKAAEQGNVAAEYELGVIYTNGEGVAQDYAEAVRWYRKAANQGLGDAQYELGNAYVTGRGVTQDFAEAAKSYRQAAEAGHTDAQWNLGAAYYLGNGVAQDYSEAAKWFLEAARRGHADAQCDLGAAYRDGRGVIQDFGAAAEWFSKAAAQGQAHAQLYLGVAYETGNGFAQDYAKAAYWYRKAAEQGLAAAQFSLGYRYECGGGVVQDYIQAHLWMNLAAAHDNVTYVAARDKVSAKMSPVQIAEAQRLARDWKPQPK
jgi:TPR repeat protein